MPSLDSLPADQRAVLQLVLQRGHSYDEIAKLLSIDRAAVRDRALSALDALGPQTGVPSEQRALITDYLLGQLPPRVSNQVVSAWQAAPARELGRRCWRQSWPRWPAGRSRTSPPRAPMPGTASHRPPANPRLSSQRPTSALRPARQPPRRRERSGLVSARARGSAGRSCSLQRRSWRSPWCSSWCSSATGRAPSTARARPTALPRQRRRPRRRRPQAPRRMSSRRSTSTRRPPAAGRRGSRTSSCRAVSRGSRSRRRDWLQTASVPRTPTRSGCPTPQDSHMLGFVNPGVGSNGRLQTAGALPSNAARYKQLIVTLETDANPHGPGRIVLRGPLNLR